MTCHECRNELELWVGLADLPEELREHLDACFECKQIWDDLSRLAGTFADDRAFAVTPDERATILKGINDRIQDKQPTIISRLNWLRVAAVAASVIIVAGIGITGYRAQWFGGQAGVSDTTMIAVAQADSQMSNRTSLQETLDLDEDDYSIMETAIDSTVSLDDADVLENLSDEQMQYLESHLDVRGLI